MDQREGTLTLLCRRVSQPIGDFYTTVINACEIHKMAAADVRRVTSVEEHYEGIQRKPSPRRRNEISRFISTADASFPSSVVLNISDEMLVDFELCKEEWSKDEFVRITVKISEETFEIIDGQHRLSGFDGENCDGFDIIVTLFVDLDIESRAYLFTTINSTPVRVNKSLAYDLFDVADTHSPQRTAHNVTKLLNTEEDSALYQRIKMLGVTPKFEDNVLYRPILAQGTVVKRFLELISKEPDVDRSLERKGETLTLSGQDDSIFRKFYIERKDWAIFKVLNNYFSAIKGEFTEEWDDPDNPLRKTIGFNGLMDAFVPAYKKGFEQKDVSESYFVSVAKRARENYEKVIVDAPFVTLSLEYFPAQGSSSRHIGRFFKALMDFGDIEAFVESRRQFRKETVLKHQD